LLHNTLKVPWAILKIRAQRQSVTNHKLRNDFPWQTMVIFRLLPVKSDVVFLRGTHQQGWKNTPIHLIRCIRMLGEIHFGHEVS